MGEWLRLILLIGLAGAAMTVAAAVTSRLMAEERRLARAFRKGLDGAPDASILAHGAGRGVAISLASRRIVTAWDAGGWRIDYPLDALLGVELDLDGEVAARAMRGEPRRLLDRQSGAEQEVRLRFLFDDARHPDFELALWPSQARGGPAKPRAAISEANRWIARVEAVLRRTGGALTLTQATPGSAPFAPPAAKARPAPKDEPAPWEDEPALFDSDEDELAD